MTLLELKKDISNVLVLDDSCISKFEKYMDLLLEWNEKFNLTAIKTKEEIIEKHFYDCLLPVQMIDLNDKYIADLGTGAGFPGLVWSICFPSSKFVLIESTGKKCKFLKEVVDKLNLKNVDIINDRVENVHKFETFDLVTSRAMSSLQIILEVGVPLLKIGGHFLAMKGSKGEEEIKSSKHCLDELKCSISAINKASLPTDDSKRINILVRKDAKTPKKYPRPWSNIVSKPL